MAEREAELLPVPYFHVVFTLPAAIGDIAYQNKARDLRSPVQGLGRDACSRSPPTPSISAPASASPSVLHTWGSAMTHHPHVHMIVPGGGLSPDGERWIAAKPNFFLPVLVLSKLFRRLMLEKLAAAHAAGKLTFFGAHAHLADAKAFAAFLAPLRKTRWFVYAKRPFAGPEGRARLSVALHPPRRHLQPPPDRGRRDERHLQGQGLPGRGARPLHHDDARHGRVHPPLPHPRAARRASTASATTASSPAATKAENLRQAAQAAAPRPRHRAETQPTADADHERACHSVPLLRRAHASSSRPSRPAANPHHRPTAPAGRHQDRHVMSTSHHPTTAVPTTIAAAARAGCDNARQCDVCGHERRLDHRRHRDATLHSRRQLCPITTQRVRSRARSPLASCTPIGLTPEIPIALAAPSLPTSRGFLPWRLSDAGPGACRTVVMGRHPKPFTNPEELSPQARVRMSPASRPCGRTP